MQKTKPDPIRFSFRLKKIFKRLMTVLLILIVVALLICYFDKLRKTDTRKNVNEEPLAVFSHVEPADDKYINREGMMKMIYKYGQLQIPESHLGI